MEQQKQDSKRVCQLHLGIEQGLGWQERDEGVKEFSGLSQQLTPPVI